MFVNVLIKPFWVFGIDRTVQNTLGSSEYGLYFAVFNFTYLFQILLDFGFQNYSNREVAANTKRINDLLPSILIFKTALMVVYILVCIAVAYPMGYLSHAFIWIILANQILLSFTIYLRSNITAHQYFITDAMLSVLDKLLMIVFCSILIWGDISWFRLSIFNFALAQLAAYSITFIVCLFFVYLLTEKIVLTLSWSYFTNIARETMPYAVIYFLMTTYYRIDGVMLEKLQGANGAAESGIYAQGYRIMEALNNIGYLFAGILLPLFSYRIAQKLEIKSLLKSGFSIIYCVAVAIIIGLFTYKQDIIKILYSTTADVGYSAEVFGYLLLNFFPVALLYVVGTLLTANKNFKWMIYTLLLAVMLNISLNFYLITNFGAKGAGIATLITQLFMLVAYSIYCIRIFNLSFSIKYFTQLFAYASLCLMAIYFLSKQCFSTNNLYDLAIHIACYFAFIPFITFLSGLINKQTFQLKVGVDK